MSATSLFTSTLACTSTPEPSLPLLCGHAIESAQRHLLEGYIHTRYAATYQANISHFLPFLMATWSENQLQGVLGLRPGACGAFFVENYLDTPIENIVALRHGATVAREQIIETGNLAGSRGSSQLLFIALTEVLFRAGFRWVTFTATTQVNALLQRLGFAPHAICIADPERLGEQRKAWGTYYDNRPCVVIGDVQQAWQTLKHNEFAQKILADHNEAIAAIVEQLRSCHAACIDEGLYS
ncbi:MAG: thermostable hemolysin [Gammaproteobacteria bacterium]|nr:thermostable hemolysin [Gammaproteobacteria bacterium]MDP2140601.1 thermostable hemolysin [Gammaproteobacteria bacterium]MDP2347373.1 thermostable hemolysin [Gammaproteobacteria bacterium]